MISGRKRGGRLWKAEIRIKGSLHVTRNKEGVGGQKVYSRQLYLRGGKMKKNTMKGIYEKNVGGGKGRGREGGGVGEIGWKGGGSQQQS